MNNANIKTFFVNRVRELALIVVWWLLLWWLSYLIFGGVRLAVDAAKNSEVVLLIIVVSLFVTICLIMFPKITMWFIHKKMSEICPLPPNSTPTNQEEWIKVVGQAKTASEDMVASVPQTDLKKIEPTKKDPFVDRLIKLMNDKKHALIAQEVAGFLNKKTRNKKIDLFVRRVLDVAYSHTKPPLQDIITNLEQIFVIWDCKSSKMPVKDANGFACLLIKLAVLYIEKEDYDKVIQTVNKIEKFNKEVPAKNLSRAYFIQGVAYLQKDNAQLGIAYFKKAIELSEDISMCANAYSMLAQIYYARFMDPENIIENAQYAIENINIKEKTEQYIHMVSLTVIAQAFLGRFEDAYETIENAEHIMEKGLRKISVGLDGYKSYVALKLGKYKDARRLSDIAIRSNVADVTATNVRSILDLKNGDYETAITNFKNIEPKFDKNSIDGKYYLAEIYYNMGTAYYHLKEYENADEYFNKAIDNGYSNFDSEHLIETKNKLAAQRSSDNKN